MTRFIILLHILLFNILCLHAQNKNITSSFEQYDSIYVQEKIYLQTDRTIYKPGDQVWFKVWLVNAQNQLSTISEDVIVELVDPKGAIIQMLTLNNNTISLSNTFKFNNQLKGGLYKIRCYSKWMQHLGENNFYEKEITLQKVVLPDVLMKLDFEKEAYGANDTVKVEFSARTKDNFPLGNKPLEYSVWIKGHADQVYQATTNADGKIKLTYVIPEQISSIDNLINVKFTHEGKTESISRSAPLILGNLDIQFLPEGGNLVQGHPNRVAIKVLNEFGKPADVEGQLLTVDGEKVVQEFSTYHQGMGAFVFTPVAGQQYVVNITKPQLTKKRYMLPSAGQAVGLFLRQNDANKIVLDVYSPSSQSLILFAQQQGQVLLENKIQAQEGVNTFELPSVDLPMGIVQLTVFDTNQKPLAERLVFANKHRKITTKITTDKSIYTPREQVKANLSVTDETGKGVQGQFTMAVVDDNNLTFADDKQDDIRSALLMSTELKGEVYEPNFYFDPKETKADTALDYVMLTHGWRRFEWVSILSPADTVPPTSPKHISGVFYRNGSPIKNKTILLSKTEQIPNKKTALATTTTDHKGYFLFEELSINLPVYMHVKDHGFSVTKVVNYFSREGAEIHDIGRDMVTYTNNNQGTGGVSGKLFDEELDEGLPFANVTLRQDGRLIKGTTTDFDGNFDLNNIVAGKYQLLFSYVGYPSVHYTIFIKNGELVNITAYMNEGTQSLSSPITISANKTTPVGATAGNIAQLHLATPIRSSHVTSAPYPTIRNKKNRGKQRKKSTKKGKILTTEDLEDISARSGNSTIPSNNNSTTTVLPVTPADEGEDVSTTGSRASGNDVYVDGVRAIGRIPLLEQDATTGGQTLTAADIRNLTTRDISSIAATTAGVYSQDVGYSIDRIPSQDIVVQSCVVVREPIHQTPNRYRTSTDIDMGLEPKFALQQLAPVRKYYSSHFTYTAPNYADKQKPTTRTDFRKTIYWNNNIKTNAKGKNTLPITYYNSDANTTFRITIEGVGQEGQLIHGEQTYATEMPFGIAAKLPSTFCFGDSVSIPITIKNNTAQAVVGQLKMQMPKHFQYLGEFSLNELNVPADSFLVLQLPYYIKFEKAARTWLQYEFEGPNCNDKVNLNVDIVSKGFPRGYSLSARKEMIRDTFIIDEHYDGSLESELNVYPNPIDGLLDGASAILREPHGCFEQVSSSNYPNILALQVMQQQPNSKNPLIEEKALGFLRNGYSKLAAYEINGGGFEWYGRAPAHEGLTAYGLLQFHEMQAVCDIVDQPIIDRTIRYLLKRRNGKGGFKQNVGKYGFGGKRPAVFDAYITWALTTAGVEPEEIKKEIKTVTQEAIKSEDIYRMSLAALIQYNIGNTKKAEQLTESISRLISKTGIANVHAASTLTYSYGYSNNIETLSFAILAMLQHTEKEQYLSLVENAITHIQKYRRYGKYGSTQATVMAMKASLAYQNAVTRVEEDVQFVVRINNANAYSFTYKAGSNIKMNIPNLNQYLQVGKNTVEVTSKGGEPLPFTLDTKWKVATLNNASTGALVLESSLSSPVTNMGETVRLDLVIKNTKDEIAPSPMVVVGIPAGLSLQPWQLKKLQEEKAFDYYEIKDNFLYLYYSEMDAAATRNIALDLKTEVIGTFTPPASSAYLYYYSEKKNWVEGQTITIQP